MTMDHSTTGHDSHKEELDRKLEEQGLFARVIKLEQDQGETEVVLRLSRLPPDSPRVELHWQGRRFEIPNEDCDYVAHLQRLHVTIRIPLDLDNIESIDTQWQGQDPLRIRFTPIHLGSTQGVG